MEDKHKNDFKKLQEIKKELSYDFDFSWGDYRYETEEISLVNF